jgi:hypothetical protein
VHYAENEMKEVQVLTGSPASAVWLRVKTGSAFQPSKQSFQPQGIEA